MLGIAVKNKKQGQYIYVYIYIVVVVLININHVIRVLNTTVEQNIRIQDKIK